MGREGLDGNEYTVHKVNMYTIRQYYRMNLEIFVLLQRLTNGILSKS